MADANTAASVSTGTTSTTSVPTTATATEGTEKVAAQTEAAGSESKAADGSVTKTDAKTWAVKVDGETVTVSEEELLKGYSKASAADKRMQEAAKAKKDAESEKGKVARLVAAAKQGDYGALKEAGLTNDEIEQLSIKVINDKLQVELEQERIKGLDPAQRELEELRRFKAEQEKNSKAADEKQKGAERDREIQGVKQAVTKNVIDTLERFPAEYKSNDLLAQLVVDAWSYCYENDLKETPEHVAQEVEKEFRGLYKLMIGKAKDEELEEYVPADVKERLLKIAKAKVTEQAHPSLTAQPQVRAESKPGEKKPRLSTAALLRRQYFRKD